MLDAQDLNQFDGNLNADAASLLTAANLGGVNLGDLGDLADLAGGNGGGNNNSGGGGNNNSGNNSGNNGGGGRGNFKNRNFGGNNQVSDAFFLLLLHSFQKENLIQLFCQNKTTSEI